MYVCTCGCGCVDVWMCGERGSSPPTTPLPQLVFSNGASMLNAQQLLPVAVVQAASKYSPT